MVSMICAEPPFCRLQTCCPLSVIMVGTSAATALPSRTIVNRAGMERAVFASGTVARGAAGLIFFGRMK